MEQTKKRVNTRYITELGLFIGVILLMKLTGLSSIPVGPLVMTFTMIPIAVGAMLLGPLAGTILGAFYGLLSLYDAITGKSMMTAAFMTVERRWAMTKEVRPIISRSRAACTIFSLSVSRAEVASSRMSMGGLPRMALAMPRRCLWPPESLIPRCPISVS